MSMAIVAGVAGAAVTAGGAYLSSKESGDVPDAPLSNPKRDIRRYVNGVSASLPNALEKESEFRPQFQGLNLQDMLAFLGGTNGQMGLIGMGREYGQQAGQQISDQRGAEFGQMTGQTGLARLLFDQMSPEAAAQVQRANQEAQRSHASAQGLNFQETRAADQQSREGFAARGMLNSNSSVANDALSRFNVLGQKRQEAAQRGQEAYNFGSQFYSQPGLQALSSVPHGYSAGQNQIQTGLGAIGSGTPQLFDFNAALDQGATDRQNQFAASMAQNAAKQNQYSGYMQIGGQLMNSGLNAWQNR